MESPNQNRQGIKLGHASDSASSQNEYLHYAERDRFGASMKQDIIARAGPHLRMTVANLAAHELRMARAPADNSRQDRRRLLAAARDLGFGDIAGWVIHEERKVNLSMGKRPMEKWLNSRDERLMPCHQRSSGLWCDAFSDVEDYLLNFGV